MLENLINFGFCLVGREMQCTMIQIVKVAISFYRIKSEKIVFL